MNIITDNFAIKADESLVQAFANQRIPFETKADWRADFRKALKDAVSRLSGQENDELAAVYGSSLANDPVDTENCRSTIHLGH